MLEHVADTYSILSKLDNFINKLAGQEDIPDRELY